MSIVLLPDEIEVRFRFHDAFGFPVCLWKKSNYENRIRIGITTESASRTLKRCVKVYEKDGRLTTVPEFPELGPAHDEPSWTLLCFVFRLDAKLLPLMLHRLSVYLETVDKEVSAIGEAQLVPSQMTSGQGVLELPLMSESLEPVGNIKVDYLIVQPFKHDSQMERPVDWWRPPKTGSLHIGHRGVGVSLHKNCRASEAENTLPSLNLARKSGADYVEFDVSLTKDKELVLFHDSQVQIRQESQVVSQELRNMTASELKQAQVVEPSKAGEKKSEFFPTLTEALENVDESLGFLVEAKFPEPRSFAFDCNEYADILLTTLFQSAKSRRVILTSFDADFCTALRVKQSTYPVLFSTCLGHSAWPDFAVEIRSRSVNLSLAFTEAENFLGMNAFRNSFVENPSLIKSLQSKGKVLFLWSEKEMTKDDVQLLEEKGANGIIYDRIDVIRSETNVT
ncbi:glycerophosphocholine phosphodiesterase GPCPD1-like [Oscarella lobularis]|uniref:glycerophosphocholine phosphodiesterase GPCPD1-like n=1 Tax=Oscarella lobularis TaxID=121494 RepID=UPI0033133E6F